MEKLLIEKKESKPVTPNQANGKAGKFGMKKKKIIRNKEKGIQKIRFIVQTLFALLCIWIGMEFYQFVHFLETNGTVVFSSRPPGVDGFLPISSFLSFFLFLMTGQIHPAHPAGGRGQHPH